MDLVLGKDESEKRGGHIVNFTFITMTDAQEDTPMQEILANNELHRLSTSGSYAAEQVAFAWPRGNKALVTYLWNS